MSGDEHMEPIECPACCSEIPPDASGCMFCTLVARETFVLRAEIEELEFACNAMKRAMSAAPHLSRLCNDLAIGVATLNKRLKIVRSELLRLEP